MNSENSKTIHSEMLDLNIFIETREIKCQPLILMNSIQDLLKNEDEIDQWGRWNNLITIVH